MTTISTNLHASPARPASTAAASVSSAAATARALDMTIVMVNYRTPEDAINSLASLAEHGQNVVNFRVILVDNASGDGSVSQIADAIAARGWSPWVDLLPLPHNGGYASGNNAGIQRIIAQPQPPRYVLLLNPDTIVRPEALTRLMDFMESNPKAGMAGSRLEDPDGTPQCSAFRFPSACSELDAGMRLGIVTRLLHRWIAAPPPSDKAHATDWVAGAAMIIRTDLFAQLGLLMDDRYFMYFEEVDFCFEARRAGWSCWYVPSSHVVHLVGQSSGVTDTRRAPRRRPAYWFESRRRFFLRNRGFFRTALADLAFAVGFATWRVRRRLQGKPDTDPPHMLWDFLRHSVWMHGPRL
ncbi:MAG: glycosyltransferase family 2 protein [Phycisphaeraceae bacterium]